MVQLNLFKAFNRESLIGILITCLMLAVLIFHSNHRPESSNQTVIIESKLPDFSTYTTVAEKKEAFFNYLRPIIRQQNQKIRYSREFLNSLDITNHTEKYHAQAVLKKIARLAKSYNVKADNLEDRIAALKVKVDVIPESLVLVQAAMESAWGSSRFALEANNLFGEWCFKKGCGLVPEDRDEGRRHQIRVFSSPVDSVASYMKNLNSHSAYKEFRLLRAQLREKGEKLSGLKLANGLKKYSERRNAYVEELVMMIEQNELE